MLVKGKDVQNLQDILNGEFNVISKWFDVNKLSVNKSKTNTMLLCGSRSRHRDAKLNINVRTDSNETLTQVSQAKFLGVELDEHLSFDQHIDKRCGKVRSRSGILWRMRTFIPESLAHDLYTRLIHPHVTYADIVYDACSQQSKNPPEYRTMCG